MNKGGCPTNTLTGSISEAFMAINKTYIVQSSAKKENGNAG